ncbi:MAG: D-arabinono-1,4-lactone oxidase, partial [Naasia sp.]
LPHISVAGAIMTATHGSGERHQNLAATVSSSELGRADGERVVLRRGEPGFAGSVVGLGALGVITALTLDLVPAFEIRQYVYDDLTRDSLGDNLDAVLGAGYSVSLFTNWQSTTINHVWLKRLSSDEMPPGPFFGAEAADGKRGPIPGMDPTNATDQGGVPGPWHARLPHFKLEFTPSAGEEIQSEFFVAASDASAAFAVIKGLAHVISPLLFVCEIRAVAADDLWLSGAYGRDTVAFHFTWHPEETRVREVLAQVEAGLAPFGARPHWGKVFTAAAAQIAPLYPRFDDFLALRSRLDPDGRFRSGYTDRILDGTTR